MRNCHMSALRGSSKARRIQILLRFEPAQAQVWLDAPSVVAFITMFLGLGNPKHDCENSVAKVTIK